MKSEQLPPVRVSSAVLEEIQNALREGESLSQFIETAVTEAARARTEQEAFLERGRQSLADALRTGEFHSSDEVLDAMERRVAARSEELKRKFSSRP